MISCPVNPASENIADFIYRRSGPYSHIEQISRQVLCREYASREFDILYFPLDAVLPISLAKYDYYSIPKLFTLLDTSSMEAAGILPVFQQPALNNRGKGCLSA